MDYFAYKSPVDKDRIYQLLDELLHLVHAGFLKTDISSADLAIIRSHLHIEIGLCAALVGAELDVEGVTAAFFARVEGIIELLSGDLEAIFEGDPAADSSFEIVLAYPGFYAISVYRLAHELALLEVPLLPRIMAERAHSLTGIDINPRAKIADHFFIDHGTGIVIGETCIIGSYVKLYQGVTLGALSTRGGQRLKGVARHPLIEDRVTIYAGASVLGNVRIGEGSTLGSNVFITTDVEPGRKVAAQPMSL